MPIVPALVGAATVTAASAMDHVALTSISPRHSADRRVRGSWWTLNAWRAHHRPAASAQQSVASSKSRPLSRLSAPSRASSTTAALTARRRRPPEVEGDDGERGAGGQRERVEDRDRLGRLEAEQLRAPRDRGCQHRGDVDRRRRQHRQAGERREMRAAPRGAQRREAAVDPEPPRGRVALGCEEVTPVLDHEPRGDDGELGAVCARDDPRQGEAECRDEEHQADRAFVHAVAEEVHPRPVAVALDAHADAEALGGGRHACHRDDALLTVT